MTEFCAPLDWLKRLGSQLKEFYDFQCQEAKRILHEEQKNLSRTILKSARKTSKQTTLPASVQKTTKVCQQFVRIIF